MYKEILLCLFLTGCATTPVRVVATCPKPQIPAEPKYPTSTLRAGDSYETVAKAYVITDKMKSQYINELKSRLKVYE